MPPSGNPGGARLADAPPAVGGSCLADTSAVIEIIGGNAAFTPYAGAQLYTSPLVLMELYYVLRREYDEAVARRWYDLFLERTLPWEEDITVPAMEIRLRLRRRKLSVSYVDAMAYTAARFHGMDFLTTDRAFSGLPGVVFVEIH